MTSRTGCILAGTIALALLSGTAAYSQAADATSAASQAVSAPAAVSAASSNPAAHSPAHPRAAFLHIDLYDAALGPLFVLAWVLFAAGFIRRISLFRSLTRPARAGLSALPARSQHSSSGSVSEDIAFLTRGTSGVGKLLFRLRRWIRRTVFGARPVMGVVSLAFHIGLFLVPFLLPAHNILFSRSTHFSLPTLPGPLADRLTLGLLAVGGLLSPAAGSFSLGSARCPRFATTSSSSWWPRHSSTAYMAYHHVAGLPHGPGDAHDRRGDRDRGHSFHEAGAHAVPHLRAVLHVVGVLVAAGEPQVVI